MSMDLNELLGIDDHDPAAVAAKQDVQAYIALIESLIATRKSCALTQEDVAKLMATTQSAISKFESVGGDARFSTVQRYARAVGSRLRVIHDVPTGRTVASVKFKSTPTGSGFYRRSASA